MEMNVEQVKTGSRTSEDRTCLRGSKSTFFTGTNSDHKGVNLNVSGDG